MSEELKIKPCPFCGNKDLMLGEPHGTLGGCYFVACWKCYSSGPMGKRLDTPEESMQSAWERWNERYRERTHDDEGKDD